MNNVYGITGLKVAFFVCERTDVKELNKFLSDHDGNIVDIQYQKNNMACHQVMVVYTE